MTQPLQSQSYYQRCVVIRKYASIVLQHLKEDDSETPDNAVENFREHHKLSNDVADDILNEIHYMTRKDY